MKFVEHPSNNMVLGAPLGMKDCVNLPATVAQDVEGRDVIQSFWLPEPEELAALNAGKPIMLTIYGHGHPPVKVEVEA